MTGTEIHLELLKQRVSDLEDAITGIVSIISEYVSARRGKQQDLLIGCTAIFKMMGGEQEHSSGEPAQQSPVDSISAEPVSPLTP